MPSASLKLQQTENNDPVVRLITQLEKKIRNLEKRKAKLENYKSDLENGIELEADQLLAVKAYDGVIASLELCKELLPQIENAPLELSKIQKIQQKKFQEEKNQSELERTKQVLRMQDVLTRLNIPEVKADFTCGRNGALKVDEEKLNNLCKFHTLVVPVLGSERETTPNGVKEQIMKCAEHMSLLIEGRNKPVPTGGTYKELRSLVSQIASTHYPKKQKSNSENASKTPSPVPIDETTKATKVKKNKNKNKEAAKGNVPEKEPSNSRTVSQSDTKDTLVHETQDQAFSNVAPPMENAPPGLLQQQSFQNATQEIEKVYVPVPSYYNVNQPHPAQLPNDRTAVVDINDIMTTGNFNFLQESQVGSSENAQKAAVYVDPAVVSFGNVNVQPENMAQMREKGLSSQLPVSNVQPTAAIHSDNFVNPTIPPQSRVNPPTANPTRTFSPKKESIDSYSTAHEVIKPIHNYPTTPSIPTNHPAESSVSETQPESNKAQFTLSGSWADQGKVDEWEEPESMEKQVENFVEQEPLDSNYNNNSYDSNTDFGNMEFRRGGEGNSYRAGKEGNSYRGNGEGNSYRGNSEGNSYRGNSDGNSYRGNKEGNSYRGNSEGNSYRGNGEGNSYRGNGEGNSYRGNGEENSYRGEGERSSYRGGGRMDYRSFHRGMNGNSNGFRGRGSYNHFNKNNNSNGFASNGSNYRGRGQMNGRSTYRGNRGTYSRGRDEGTYSRGRDEGPARGRGNRGYSQNSYAQKTF